jgi:hypothetical protein
MKQHLLPICTQRALTLIDDTIRSRQLRDAKSATVLEGLSLEEDLSTDAGGVIKLWPSVPWGEHWNPPKLKHPERAEVSGFEALGPHEPRSAACTTN